MKVSSSASFDPFTLKLTIESEEDARAIYAIFNHSRNCKLLKDCGKPIRDELDKHGSFYTRVGSTIANGIIYDEFFCK